MGTMLQRQDGFYVNPILLQIIFHPSFSQSIQTILKKLMIELE